MRLKCTNRESNPGHKHGKLVCYHYTIGACAFPVLFLQNNEKTETMCIAVTEKTETEHVPITFVRSVLNVMCTICSLIHLI